MGSTVRPRSAEGQLYLIVAIDSSLKFGVVELVEKSDMRAAASSSKLLSKLFLTASNGAPRQWHPIRGWDPTGLDE
jgi:hypothetical protein